MADEDVAQNPLEALGLGVKWQPTPVSWRWATINAGGTQLQVLRLSTLTGTVGVALSPVQLLAFASEAAERVEMAAQAVPSLELEHRKRLVVPDA